MKFLSFELAKELQSAGFLLDISQFPVYEKLFLHDIVSERPIMVDLNSAIEFLAAIEFRYVWLPSFEDIMSHEYLRSYAYESLPEPIVYNRARPYSLEGGFSGLSAVEAAARAWLFVHSKRQGDGSAKL